MIFSRKKKENGEAEQEILDIVSEGQESGEIEASEAKMISNIFELSDKQAGDIMTNRGSIAAFSDDTKLKDALKEILNSSYSRYPVYHEDLDHIIGILHLKDVVRASFAMPKQNPELGEAEGLIREAVYVPETKNVQTLFKEMQSSNTQMVIVVDEYGQTSGLVAMEDILEEIVGNIRDEYDDDEDMIVDNGNEQDYLIDGLTKLEDLTERFGIRFEESEVETINGYLTSAMGHVPRENEQYELSVDGWRFVVEEVEDMVIRQVRLKRESAEVTSGPAEE